MKKFFSFAAALTGLVIFSGCKTAKPIASAPPKITFVLVHGAWGGGWDWRHEDDLLTADGNKVFRATLTGQGERSHLASTNIDLDTHIQDVANLIVWENLHDVVLVGHSYGGMVVTGVADRVPDRIKRVVYLDAILPENGESVDVTMPPGRIPMKPHQGFIEPTWVKKNQPPPHDVPMPAKCFSQTIVLTNSANVPATYILTVVSDKQAAQDDFHQFYQRAQARGWPAWIMAGDHNVQRSHPLELKQLLELAAAQ